MLDIGFDDLIDMGLVTFAHVLEMLREFKREGAEPSHSSANTSGCSEISPTRATGPRIRMA